MKASPAAYAFIKDKEKYRPTAFKPTPDDVWTLAWGHTEGVKKGDTCTREQGDAWLTSFVTDRCEKTIHDYVTVPLAQHQYDALVSFIYNVGRGAFIESMLLRVLNNGDYAGAQAQFIRWTKQKGKTLAGLVIRREEEAKMFGGEYQK